MTISNTRGVLVFPMDLAAHYLRCIELCKRLVDVEIIFADSTRYHSFIEEAGYKSVKVDNFDSDEVTRSAGEFNFSWMNKPTLEKVLNSQIEAIREYRPEIVIGDTSFTLKMAAEATGTKFVSLINGYMTKYYSYSRGVPRSHPGYKYSKILPRNIFDGISSEIESLTLIQIHEPYRRIRDDLGLGNTRYLLDELEGDYNLICDLPDIFPLKDPPENYEYVGPLFYTKHVGEEDTKEFLGEKSPRILVSSGSTGDAGCFDLLLDSIFHDYRILATGNVSKKLVGSNILGSLFLSHCAVLPKIDLVLCHGGNGTIYQALSFGVPVICFPSNFEQEWNSSRIEEMGYGTSVDNNITPSGLKEIIDFWMKRKGDRIFIEAEKSIEYYSKQPVKLI